LRRDYPSSQKNVANKIINAMIMSAILAHVGIIAHVSLARSMILILTFFPFQHPQNQQITVGFAWVRIIIPPMLINTSVG
jgi:hypothetical protein